MEKKIDVYVNDVFVGTADEASILDTADINFALVKIQPMNKNERSIILKFPQKKSTPNSKDVDYVEFFKREINNRLNNFKSGLDNE